MTLSDFAARLFPGAPLGQRLPEKTSGPGGRGTARPPCLGGPAPISACRVQHSARFVGAKPAQHAHARMGFLDLLGPFWLCLAAPVWAVSRPMLGSGRPGVLGSFRSPWGGTAAAGGGACAGAGRRALGYFCWCHFLVRTLERLSERLCRGGCRGARAARRGAAYPFGAGG